MHLSIARRATALLAIFSALAVTPHLATGQTTPAAGGVGFGLGYTDIGPAVGLGNIGSAGASFGGRLERAVKALPDMGNGILGLQASFDYYSWSNNTASFRYIPLGVTANYHFKVSNPKFDPFLGAGLGYQMISCDLKGSGLGDLCSNSELYFIGRAGGRYFFKPGMAAYADAGAGAATLSIGLMFGR